MELSFEFLEEGQSPPGLLGGELFVGLESFFVGGHQALLVLLSIFLAVFLSITTGDKAQEEAQQPDEAHFAHSVLPFFFGAVTNQTTVCGESVTGKRKKGEGKRRLLVGVPFVGSEGRQ